MRWLATGEGEMIKNSANQSIIGGGNVQTGGNSIVGSSVAGDAIQNTGGFNVFSPDNISYLQQVIQEKDERIKEKDERIKELQKEKDERIKEKDSIIQDMTKRNDKLQERLFELQDKLLQSQETLLSYIKTDK